ncbi:MAG: Ldh family oxidoreductase, partial [Betaproteobacteria bacterium]
FVNVISRGIVAPFGGGDARFGTNPFTVGIPVPGGDPILLDFATSVMAQGKARVAYNKGEQIPAGRMLDDKGLPTTDPKFAVVDPAGAILTFGEHKGYGMAVVCELLGGALTGMACQGPASGKRRVLNGMLTILFDPARLADGAMFASEMHGFIDWIKASPPQPGVERVRLAGDPEREKRAQRLASGIPVDATTWGDILKAAQRLNIDPDEIDRLAGGSRPG